MSLYIQRAARAHVEVITPDLFEKLKASDPGLVKYASVGDYTLTPVDDAGTPLLPTRVEKAESLKNAWTPVVEGQDNKVLDALEKLFDEQVEALKESLEKSYERIERLTGDVDALRSRVSELEKQTGALTALEAATHAKPPQTGNLVSEAAVKAPRK